MGNDVIHINVKKMLLSNTGVMTLDICADIPLGKLTALFGQSGSGKTTLLRMLAGLMKPDSGIIEVADTVWFDSNKKINLPPQQRNIGMMFQDYALFPNMTVEQNIKFAQNEYNNLLTNQLLEIFDLTEFAKSRPANLSGGQRQRVALARALARMPQLLLLDEPLSALDAGMRVTLQDEIARTHNLFGTTTLLVSHDLHEIFRLSSNVLCIHNGEVTKEGNPVDVFFNSSISGKFQVIGQIAAIEKQDVVNIVTVVTGNNNVVKVIALDEDLIQLTEGDRVQVSSKAFNPIVRKI
jgi:molybdate transport system ATP-binding protein